MAYGTVESLAKDLLNTKAVNDMGWSKKDRWRRTLGMAEEWQKQQKGMNVIKAKNTMASLKKSQEKTRERLEEVFGGDYSNFTLYAPTPEHLCTLGNDGKVFGHRVRSNVNFL